MNKTSKTEDFSDLTISQIIGMIKEAEDDPTKVRELRKIKKVKQQEFFKRYNETFEITWGPSTAFIYQGISHGLDKINLTEISLKHVPNFIDSINYMIDAGHYKDNPLSLSLPISFLDLLDVIETPEGTKSEIYKYQDLFLRSFKSQHTTLGPLRAKVIVKTMIRQKGMYGCYLGNKTLAEKYISYLERLI